MTEAEQTLFFELYGRRAEILASAPGRINIIGEHTDYNGGYVLPAAIHLRNHFLASRRPDNEIHVWAKSFSEMDIFSLGQLEPSPGKRWVNYIRGIFWALKEEGAALGGLDGLVWGDVPLEAGLSSSAALEVSVIKGVAELFGLSMEPEKLARLAQKAEHEFAGVKCGLMDQFIAVFGQNNSALFLDCETLAFDLIPLNLDQAGLEILVCDTRVRRELASSEYNRRREESAAALKALGKRGIRTYKEATLDLLDEAMPVMDDISFRRARHVISENQRVRASAEALRKDDFTLLGRLLFQSHESLRDDYEVSCPELDSVYETGKEFTGCLGARLVGAGFGGSALALVTKPEAEEFKSNVAARAEERGFSGPAFHDILIGGGASSERLSPI
jgi:galactokinase